MTRYWVRWESYEPLDRFEYHGPWWVSGYAPGGDDDDIPIICAAVVAEDEEDAKAVMISAYDDPEAARRINEWSFVNPRDDAWEPFCDRFPRADWMKWPWPAHPTTAAGGGR